MFTTAVAVEWLRLLGVAVPVVPGTVARLIPDTPDRICVVTVTGGAGLAEEGLSDTVAMQVRFRGNQHDPHDAEDLALDADRRLIFAPVPAVVSGARIGWVTRSGGRPSPLEAPLNSGSRAEVTCTYLVRADTLPA